MLSDDVWFAAWEASKQLGRREVRCTCRLKPSDPIRNGDHSVLCETRKGHKQLLCLECAERALGRQLALEDLMPCVGNYAHHVMQTRRCLGVDAVARAIESVAVDAVVLAVLQTHDSAELWEHSRRDPEAFREAVRVALRGKTS